jgi:hypothetical protein
MYVCMYVINRGTKNLILTVLSTSTYSILKVFLIVILILIMFRKHEHLMAP